MNVDPTHLKKAGLNNQLVDPKQNPAAAFPLSLEEVSLVMQRAVSQSFAVPTSKTLCEGTPGAPLPTPFSNYLLQPSLNNEGLIKAKPGGVYTSLLRWQLPPCPQSANRTRIMAPIWPRHTRRRRGVI